MPASILKSRGSRWIVRLLLAGVAVALVAQNALAAAPPKAAGTLGPFPAAAPTVETRTTKSRPSDHPPAKSDAYAQLKVDESLSSKHSAIDRMFRDGFGPGDQEVFNTFYNNYAFPRWTLPANATSLPDFRKDLANKSRSGGEGGAAVRAQLAEMALTFLEGLAKGKYHPAVRYNAMLTIGELSGPALAGSRSVQPLPAALPKLLEAVKSADQIDAVKVAALIGVLRHASLGISNPQEREPEVVATMLTLATTKVSPGRSPEGHAWIRALAIDVLGEIAIAGQQNAVVSALATIAANAETPFVTRCAAARALGNLRYDPNAPLDPQQLAGQVARLAADAVAYEVDQKPPDFQSMLQSRQSGSLPGSVPRTTGIAIGGGPRRPRAGEPPVGMAPPVAAASVNPEPTRVETEYLLWLRRRLLTRVDAVKYGLNGPRDPERIGITGLARDPAQKSYVDGLTQRLDAVISLCESEKSTYEEFITKLKEEATLLREAIDKVPANKPAEGEPAPAKAGGQAQSKPAQ